MKQKWLSRKDGIMFQKENKKYLNEEVDWITHEFNPLQNLVEIIIYLKTRRI